MQNMQGIFFVISKQTQGQSERSTCLVTSYLKYLPSKVLRSEETEPKLFIKKQKFSASTQLSTGPAERNTKSADICSRV